MRKYCNYFIILAVAIILLIPMFLNEYPDFKSDASFHIANVLAIKEQISQGRWESLILGKIANNFGYGTRIFYPPLSQTVTAFISYFIETFNLDVLVAFKIVHFCTILFAGLTMYMCSYKFSKNSKCALLSAIIYMTMPYFLSDIYIRCALGECFIFIFVPIIFSGILSLLKGDVKHFYSLFIIGYVCGILSHLVMMMYFTILLGVFLLVYYKRIFRKEVISHLLIATLFVVAIVLPFIESIVSHKILGDYVVFQEGSMVADNICDSALNFDKYFDFFQSNSFLGIRFNFSIYVAIILLCTLVLAKKIIFPKYTKGIIICGILALYFSSSLFPWNSMPYFLKMIQFPWRLVTFVSFSISLVAPLCITVLNKKAYYFLFIIGIIVGGIQCIVFPRQSLVELNKFDYIYGIGWQGEYFPVNTINNASYFWGRSQNIIVKNDAKISINILENDVPNMIFEVNNLENDVVIELPRLFYLGYNLEKGNEIIDLYENSNGFLEAKIKENGRYILTHKLTIIQRIARVISLFTCISLVVIYIAKFRYRNNINK